MIAGCLLTCNPRRLIFISTTPRPFVGASTAACNPATPPTELHATYAGVPTTSSKKSSICFPHVSKQYISFCSRSIGFGLSLYPYPSRSIAYTRLPVAASAFTFLLQWAAFPPNPCTSTTAGPSPSPTASVYRIACVSFVRGARQRQ